MVVGIYCYKDTQKNNEVVYVGKDSNISKNERHKAHHNPSKYDDQVINRVLQNNPNRYTYHILKKGDFDENLLNALEIIYTHRYHPKFSFTIGGDGSRGYKHSPESKAKISKELSGIKRSNDFKLHLSKLKSSTGYFRVSKRKNKKYLNGFIWIYSYYEGDKRKVLMSVDLNKLERKVRSKGLIWKKFDKE